MALDTNTGIASYNAPEKELYEIGEMPPLGYVPKQMYAWVIRRERHGEPTPGPPPARGEASLSQGCQAQVGTFGFEEGSLGACRPFRRPIPIQIGRRHVS